MKAFAECVFSTIWLLFWIAGVVLAKGFWLTVLAIFIPFYAWYLVVEKIMIAIGIN